MKARLRAIAHRRLTLGVEVQQQRAAMRDSLAILRNDLAFAGLGLLAGRLLVRRPWLRALVLAGLSVAAARRITRQG